ncbi:hypothetical protein KFK09_005632 [Dendrobium nobile]|uniref:J domain-containing protein n=1 Tax=Dendrobium nobile TaxID=94219 RepID=A0A8T3BZP8_DENNO|nr:hypothetical protein KFK09_005632 [Dendrobium nobile]
MAAAGFLSPATGLFGHSDGLRRLLSRGQSSSSTPAARQLLLPLRCSSEAAPELFGTEDGAPPPTSEISVDTPKETPSLISAINITNVDHYGRLGIARDDSYDKVNIAYQQMCEEVMNQGLDEEEANKRLDLLKSQESYGILSSEEERRLYDWSLARNEMPDRYFWPFEVPLLGQSRISHAAKRLSSPLFTVAVRLRCFAGGVEIARVASSAPSSFVVVRLRSFVDFPFLSDQKLRHFDRIQQRELAGFEGNFLPFALFSGQFPS